MAKITIPTSFPNWRSQSDKPYSSDIVKSQNIRLNELSLSGEVDVNNTMSLTSSKTELVSCIFEDPDHKLSFATKNASYYIDSLIDPTVTQYSIDPASSYNLNPQSTGVVVYPRGYSYYDALAYSGTTVHSTIRIETFVDVTGFSRTYTYTENQRVVGVRMKFAYSSNEDDYPSLARIVVVDHLGEHVIAEKSGDTVDWLASWDYWFVDGTNGCDLNDPDGFTVKVKAATTKSGVNQATVNSGGSGYAIGDTFRIVQGANNVTICQVTGVSGGAVTSFDIIDVGTITASYGYYYATNVSTTKITGSGSGLTVNITGLANELTFSGSSSFDFVYEKSSQSLIYSGESGLYTIAYTGATPSAVPLYPGQNKSGFWNSNGYTIGYPINYTVFKNDYPVIMKMFNDRILVIGNGSDIHFLDSNYYANTTVSTTSDYVNYLNITEGTFTTNKFNLPDDYVIKWIETTSEAIFIGAVKYDIVNKFNRVGKSVVVVWQVSSNSQTYYDILDGETVGKAINNYLYILTAKGNIGIIYSGVAVVQYLGKIYQMPDNYTITLPHTNGVEVYKNKIAFLMPGNKIAPGGIYIFDPETNNVYHKHSFYYSTSTEYDIGGSQPQMTTGALFYMDKNGEDTFFAGISNLIKEDGSFVGGLFDSINSNGYTLTKNGYIEFGRIKAVEVDEFVDGYALKYRNTGTLYLAQKKVETFDSLYGGFKVGNWGSSVTDPSTFTMTAIPDFMKKGDRIIVMDGALRGFKTTIKGISSLTVTIDPPSKFTSFDSLVGNGDFTFLWERIGYSGTFTSSTKMTVSSSVASLISVGDEIEFISGLNAGYINYVAEIDGTTITLANPMKYTASNYTIFNIDKYTYLSSYTGTSTDTIMIDERSNEPLASDFVQFKLILNGDVKIRDFQTNAKQNLSIVQDVKGKY